MISILSQIWQEISYKENRVQLLLAYEILP